MPDGDGQAAAPRTNRTTRKTAANKRPYHHGALRGALLDAAEQVLLREGVEGLTLRAVAREAGVSHAAPKNHFDNLEGLLSDLAAIGFERFRAMMLAEATNGDNPRDAFNATGRGYIAFAKQHQQLFLLMFRSDRLDRNRPALRKAASEAFAVLSGGVATSRNERIGEGLTLAQAAGIASAWSLVHGFAMLLLDRRLDRVLENLPPGIDDEALLKAILNDED